MIILDTNVISEIMRMAPDQQVIGWLRNQLPGQIYTTAIAETELLKGIELMPSGKRQQALLKAVEAYLKRDLANRILPFDSAAAHYFASIFAQRKSKGRPITPLDTQIAAIVRSHNATLATRNTRDFIDCGIQLINPWHAK